MRLWTWQTPDFSLTSGRVELRRSFYYSNNREFPAAYAEVAKLLGTDQLVWCYVRREDCEHPAAWSSERVEWVLEVPDGEIAFADDDVWSRMIGCKACSIKRWNELWAEAPAGIISRNAYVERRLDEVFSEPSPPEGWPSRLLVSFTPSARVAAIIRHPIPEAWVVSDGRS